MWHAHAHHHRDMHMHPHTLLAHTASTLAHTASTPPPGAWPRLGRHTPTQLSSRARSDRVHIATPNWNLALHRYGDCFKQGLLSPRNYPQFYPPEESTPKAEVGGPRRYLPSLLTTRTGPAPKPRAATTPPKAEP